LKTTVKIQIFTFMLSHEGVVFDHLSISRQQNLDTVLFKDILLKLFIVFIKPTH